MLNSSIACEIDHEFSINRFIKAFCRCDFEATDNINTSLVNIEVLSASKGPGISCPII
jgi:hypothetical protein